MKKLSFIIFFSSFDSSVKPNIKVSFNLACHVIFMLINKRSAHMGIDSSIFCEVSLLAEVMPSLKLPFSLIK